MLRKLLSDTRNQTCFLQNFSELKSKFNKNFETFEKCYFQIQNIPTASKKISKISTLESLKTFNTFFKTFYSTKRFYRHPFIATENYLSTHKRGIPLPYLTLFFTKKQLLPRKRKTETHFIKAKKNRLKKRQISSQTYRGRQRIQFPAKKTLER